MRPKALIFDVFGTLVNWRDSVAREVSAALQAKGIEANPHHIADLWRAEYDPSMAPIRDGQRGFTALDILHRENLDTVLERLVLGSHFNAEERANLATCWERLAPWPDVLKGMKVLRGQVFLAPCSNGSVALMVRLARHAGFQWDCILGAEVARNYKPHPAVYLESCTALGLPPEDVMMVAAHNSDLVAAQAAGLKTGFFPRPTENGPEQKNDLAPEGAWTVVARDFADLAAKL